MAVITAEDVPEQKEKSSPKSHVWQEKKCYMPVNLSPQLPR